MMRAFGTPAAAPQPAASANARELPHVRAVVDEPAAGGYAEAVVRILILLARARGSVRSERLERSRRMLLSHRPFAALRPEDHSRLIFEQGLIVEFAPEQAITSLAELLREPVDRSSALGLALEIAGPIEDMDAATIDMFGRIESALLTMAAIPNAGIQDEADKGLKQAGEAA